MKTQREQVPGTADRLHTKFPYFFLLSFVSGHRHSILSKFNTLIIPNSCLELSFLASSVKAGL